MRGALGRPEVRRYLITQALSLFGDSALWIANGIWAKTLTGSSSAAGLVFFVFIFPALFSPLAGLLVDRMRRRRALIGANLIGAVALCGLLAVRGSDQLWVIYLVTFVHGCLYTVIVSAQSAFLRTLVPDDTELASANAALQTARQTLRLLSPVAGAGLFTLLGGGAVALLDAGVMLTAAVLLSTIRVAEPAPTRPEHHWSREVGAGLAHLRQAVVLRRLVVAIAAAFLVVGFAETVIFSVVDQGLGRSPSFVGVIDLVQGAGSVAAGLVAARVLNRYGPLRATSIALGLVAVGIAALAPPSVAVVLVGAAVIGVGVPWLVISLNTTIQRSAPSHLQGRVFSTVDLFISVPQTTSIGLGALLASLTDYRILVAAMVAGVLASAAWLVTRPKPVEPPPTEASAPDPATATVP